MDTETTTPVAMWSTTAHTWVRVIDRSTLFGRDVARVAAEGGEHTFTAPWETLRGEPDFDMPTVLSTIAAARLWSALGSDLLLAPLFSRVLPLPHQFRVVRKAMSSFPVRLLLADEVGMGKTIAAGLVLKELKLRGQVERVLVLAPKSLLLQWIAEMDTLFGEQFDLVLPAQWGEDVAMRSDNAWKRNAQVVTSVDSVKPRDLQRGWSPERLARYNLERFHDLVGAGWDLVIMDEAHKMAGASDDVSRYELASELAKAVPHVLLLTATPHSGKSDAFLRLIALLDTNATSFGAEGKKALDKVVVRTEKRTATDSEGNALFAPRSTTLQIVPFGERHALQQALYQEVSNYVIEEYGKSVRGGRSGGRLLLLLIQRLVSSSTRAVHRFLQQRSEALRDGDIVTHAFLGDTLPDDSEPETMAETLLLEPALSGEEKALDSLIALACRVEAAGPDARAEALYEDVLRLAREDGDPSIKVLVFTEFTATQQMLREYLEPRGFVVAILNGTMELAERRAAQTDFQERAQFLVSTDAGGEGLNLQFAHVVINYDLPWNPMRVEQRIGRVDRIGQTHPVTAINLALENSVEARLYDIWQTKLATILAEFGVDKTGDVLDSAEAGIDFERLARTVLLAPESLDNEFDRLVTDVRRAAEKAQDANSAYTEQVDPIDRPPSLPVSAWVRTMMSASAGAEEEDFTEVILERVSGLQPLFADGRPVPCLAVDGLGFTLDGWFSIWRVGIAEGSWCQRKVIALFNTDDGTPYVRSAQRIWDDLASGQVTPRLTGETSDYSHAGIRALAEQEAASVYASVVHQTQESARQRASAIEMSYLARRTALAGIEPSTLREGRRLELERDFQRRHADISLAIGAVPELTCVFLARMTAQ